MTRARESWRAGTGAAGFAESLRGRPNVSGSTLRTVEGWAKAAARPDYPADAELVELIGIAARLKGEGVYSSR